MRKAAKKKGTPSYSLLPTGRGVLASLSVVLGLMGECPAGEVGLAWDTVHDERVAHYEVHIGTSSRAYVSRVETAETSVVVSGLLTGRRYFFAVRACDEHGINCSSFSNEVNATLPYAAYGDCSGNDIVGRADPNATEPGVGPAPIWMADYSTEINNDWTFVYAPTSYTKPVVIAGPPTYHGENPGVVRLRNVSGFGFDLRFQEWDYRRRVFADNYHAIEAIPYMVLQAGRHVMSDASVWEVGTFALAGTGNWHRILFSAPFDDPPHLFLTVQTYKGVQAVSARARDVTVDGFEAALFEEEALMDGHFLEIVGYLAVESPAGGGLIDLDGVQVPYLLQGVGANHRWTSVLSHRLKVEEEQSRDREVGHIDETLHALALGTQLFAQQVTHNGGDTTALRRLEITTDTSMEWGLIRGVDHNWQTLPFGKTYTDPVLVAKPSSNHGDDPGVIRLRKVTATHAQLRYQEWNYLDERHTREDIFYLVGEAGEHSLGDLSVEVDWLTTDKLGRAGHWEHIPFNTFFTANPVVLASVMTFSGTDAVTTRIKNLDPSGFELTMAKQESKPAEQINETLGWIAIEQGTGTTSEGRRLQVFFDRLDHSLTPVVYPTATSYRYPTVVGDVDSTFGNDPVFLRYASPTNTQIELKLTEEQSADTETGHVPEDVGIFVGE